MKRRYSLQALLLIAALLFSQFSTAYALSPYSHAFGQSVSQKGMHDCDMEMSVSITQRGPFVSQSATDMTQVDNSADITVQTMTQAMDCCDDDIADTTTCCESDCQCNSVIASGVLLSHVQQHCPNIIKQRALIFHTNGAPQPFLHQPKRPPIHIFS